MGSLFNQYSFVIAALVVGLGLTLGLWRWRRPGRVLKIALLVGYALIAGGINLAFHYPASTVETVDDVEAMLVNSRPTFVMLYSDY